MSRHRDLPDWRNAEAYEFLLRAERSIFAWEWLRRQPAYRAAAHRNGACYPQLPLGALAEQPEAQRWGLHTFVDPALSAAEARPIWRFDRCPLVLQARAEPSTEDPDSFALERVRHFARVAASPDTERLLLSDGGRSIRIDVRGASMFRGPVRLSYELRGIAAAKVALLVLRRFLAFASENDFSRSLHAPDPRAKRQVLLLRTYDALAEGADQRTIAIGLLSQGAAAHRWRVKSPSLRSQVQRFVRGARFLAAGGFWNLLL